MQAVFVVALSEWLLLVGAFVMGVAAQGSKICVDTIVQTSVDDAYRGRVFSFYDVIFNIAFVSAAAFGAVTLPTDGNSRAVFAVVAVGYAVTAVVYARATKHLTARTADRRRVDHVRHAFGTQARAPREASTTCYVVDAASGLLGGPPAAELGLGVLAGQRAVLEAQLQQVLLGLADHRTGRHAEDRHDRVAVEVGPDRVELLLLAQPRDPLLEVVVGPPELLGLALVAGGAVRPGQLVQPVEQRRRRRGRSGAPPSRSTRRCRTRGSAGAARPAATRPR